MMPLPGWHTLPTHLHCTGCSLTLPLHVVLPLQLPPWMPLQGAAAAPTCAEAVHVLHASVLQAEVEAEVAGGHQLQQGWFEGSVGETVVVSQQEWIGGWKHAAWAVGCGLAARDWTTSLRQFLDTHVKPMSQTAPGDWQLPSRSLLYLP